MITISDIAKLAGVSKATVSRTMNNNGYVGEDARRRIEEIIEQYHYVPSAGAVSLSRQESSAVGIVVPEIDNMFYSELLRGITEVADQNDLLPYFFDTQNQAQKEINALHILSRQRVKGLLLAPAADYSADPLGIALRKQLKALNIPVVIVDRDMDNLVWDGVFYENYESSFRAACELFRAGNRRNAIITGDLHLKIARDRLEGFRAGLHACGLTLREEDIYKGDFMVPLSCELARRMLSQRPLPDGVYTCSNRTSLGFLKAANELGIKPGRDIALIGNDRIETLNEIGIPFSCVYRDNKEMGRISFQTLMKRIEAPDAACRIIKVPYMLQLQGTEKKLH